MMRLGGRFNDQQIIPAEVVDDIRHGGNRGHFALAAYPLLPGWSYRSMWWVSHNEHGAFTARGIHGAGGLCRSRRRDGDRPFRVASGGRQRESRSNVAAGLPRDGQVPDARLNVSCRSVTRDAVARPFQGRVRGAESPALRGSEDRSRTRCGREGSPLKKRPVPSHNPASPSSSRSPGHRSSWSCST